MIFIGVGSNLPSERYGSPLETCRAALAAVAAAGVTISRRSRWYESAPVPPSGQPWFVNAVAEVATELPPESLLAILHGIEEKFGRVRRERNEARILDLDLLASSSVGAHTVNISRTTGNGEGDPALRETRQRLMH